MTTGFRPPLFCPSLHGLGSLRLLQAVLTPAPVPAFGPRSRVQKQDEVEWEMGASWLAPLAVGASGPGPVGTVFCSLKENNVSRYDALFSKRERKPAVFGRCPEPPSLHANASEVSPSAVDSPRYPSGSRPGFHLPAAPISITSWNTSGEMLTEPRKG